MNLKNAAHLSRRTFLRGSAAGGMSVLIKPAVQSNPESVFTYEKKDDFESDDYSIDLTPAKWIWYPCARVLQNTVILFRKELIIDSKIKSAKGWILGDSRYKLFVNGAYIQFGPAPADPRWAEVDPVDLSKSLKTGKNVIGAQVLYFGQGDGTWPMGKPGFIFFLEIELISGKKYKVISDKSWESFLAKSWPPGQYKRWYLRALQEEFDARKYPHLWNTCDFQKTKDWLAAKELQGDADKPSLNTNGVDYLYDSGSGENNTQLRKRSIPLMSESDVYAKKMVESHWLVWHRPPREYFECLTENSFSAKAVPAAKSMGENEWKVELKKDAAVLTFEFMEQIVGWPKFEIDAPAGTTIELLVQEAHVPFAASSSAPALMNNHFHSWTRFICKKGINAFETFDFESFRWIQLHIHGAKGMVRIRHVGCRRRIYPFANQAHVSTRDNRIQKLVDATLNTIYNSAQETIVDGMARERQQYSGDVGHVLHATIPVFGEHLQASRYVRTFSQGLTKEGYFMDCWPAYDRLNRIAQRQLDLTPWGPLLDHGIGFNFDCYYYYLYTGDLKALHKVFPRLVRFISYLSGLIDKDGLIPSEDIGTPTVWIEHGVSKKHVKCSLNLYAAAMLKNAFAPLAEAFSEKHMAETAIQLSDSLLQNTIKSFWSKKYGLFVNNLPWINDEKNIQLYDRALATAILFDLNPEGDFSASIKALVERPNFLHLSYPANAGWQLWALAKAGRVDKILDDFESRWLKMPSINLNNSLGEWFELQPDSSSQWCHAPVAPLYVIFMNIAGIKPLTPGCRLVEIFPQMDRLENLELTFHTPFGPIGFKGDGKIGERHILIDLPQNIVAHFIVNKQESINNYPLITENENYKTLELSGGKKYNFELQYS